MILKMDRQSILPAHKHLLVIIHFSFQRQVD